MNINSMDPHLRKIFVTCIILITGLIFFACESGTGGNQSSVKPIEGKVWFDTTFYPSGKPRQIESYLDSLRSGLRWGLFETGELETVVHNRLGKRYGWSFSFYKNGQTNQEYFLQEKTFICTKKFSEAGDLVIAESDSVCPLENYRDPTYTDWKSILGKGAP